MAQSLKILGFTFSQVLQGHPMKSSAAMMTKPIAKPEKMRMATTSITVDVEGRQCRWAAPYPSYGADWSTQQD